MRGTTPRRSPHDLRVVDPLEWSLLEGSMLGRKEVQKPTPPVAQTNGHTAGPITLLTVVGETARMEGKFDIADSIQIECEVGGELRVGGSKGGFFNGNVSKIHEEPAGGAPRPVYLIEEKRAGQTAPR